MGGDSQTKFYLLRHQDHQLPQPSTVLKGVDKRGQFRTAEAKEYPTLLSKALATTLLQEIARGIQCRPLHGIPSVLFKKILIGLHRLHAIDRASRPMQFGYLTTNVR